MYKYIPKEATVPPIGSVPRIAQCKRESSDEKDFILLSPRERKDPEITVTPAQGVMTMVSGMRSAAKLSLPPRIEITPHLRHVFRFVAPTGFSAAITPANVIGALGTVCTVLNSTVQPFCSSFRIKSLTVWPGTSSSGKTDTAVTFSSTLSTSVQDTEKAVTLPEGVTVTTATHWVPPKGSLAEFWQAASAQNFMRITCSPGSVLDLDVEYTISNTFASLSQTVATGSVGVVYYLYLDGSSTHLLVPEFLPSTF